MAAVSPDVRNPEASALVKAYRRALPETARRAVADRISHDARTRVLDAIGRAAALRRRADRLRVGLVVRRNPHLFATADRRVVTIGREALVALIQPSPSPDGAREANLRAVAGALTEAGIEYFAVRGNNDLAASVAVPADQRADVVRVLSALCRRVPGYVGPVPRGADVPTGLEPAFRPSAWRHVGSAQVVRLVWFHCDPSGRYVLGAQHGCDIEFWPENEDGQLTAPRRNRVASAVPRYAAAVEVPADRFTRLRAQDALGSERVASREEFSHALPDDIRFPIDVVYTWVDGSDPAWRRRRAQYTGDLHDESHEESANDARYLNRDELRYSLRSLALNAPWVRTVYLVTDDQTPAWLDTSHPSLRVVSHRDIFRDPSLLPTFNSHAIESQLHRIEGLSEQFLYFNDDIFLGNPVTPNLFFHSNGLTKYFPSSALVPHGLPSHLDPPVAAAGKNNRKLIEDNFGTTLIHKMKHVPHALRRSVQAEIEEKFAEEHRATAAARFRSVSDISVASSLGHYYGYHTGRAVPGEIRYDYVDLAHRNAGRRLGRILAQRDFDVFCVNDTVSTENAVGEQLMTLVPFLQAYFPLPSPFELPGK